LYPTDSTSPPNLGRYPRFLLNNSEMGDTNSDSDDANHLRVPFSAAGKDQNTIVGSVSVGSFQSDPESCLDGFVGGTKVENDDEDEYSEIGGSLYHGFSIMSQFAEMEGGKVGEK
jgi:hypothetical protein